MILTIPEKFIKLTSPLIIFLNFFAGLIGGGWLLFCGEWKFILITFLIGVIIPSIYSLLMIPFNFITVVPMTYFMERRKKLPCIIFSTINILINFIIEVGWIICVFTAIIIKIKSSYVGSIPFILYGYSVAITPFGYMASKESQNSISTHSSIYLMQLSYIIISVLYYLNGLYLALPLIAMLIILTIAWVQKGAYEYIKQATDCEE